MEEEKTCKSCEYYIPHFVRKRACFLEIGGHCTNTACGKRVPQYDWKIRENCGEWKPKKIKKEDRRKTIDEVQRSMEKSLREIKAILKSDQE